MTLGFATKLRLVPRPSNITTPKIDSRQLRTYGMTTMEFFLYKNSQGKIWFFEKIFLWTNTSIQKVLGIVFLSFSNENLEFGTKKLTWKSYITIKILLIVKRVKLINQYKFVEAAPNNNSNTFIIQIAAPESSESIEPTHLLQTSLFASL